MQTCSLRIAYSALFLVASVSVSGAAGFGLHRGLNVGRPFEHITSDCGQDAPGAERCYEDIERELPPGTPAALARDGFDFVRLPINPVPLLLASDTERAVLLKQYRSGIEVLLAQHLFVIADLHFWSPADPHWTATSAMTTATGPYLKLVGQMAEMLSQLPQDRVAFEPLNEPPLGPCESGTNWAKLQADMYRKVRVVAPQLNFLAMGCSGQLDQLLTLTREEIGDFDRHILYSFHFYEPFYFTHAGLGGNPSGLRYPAANGGMAQALAMTTARVQTGTLRPPEAANRLETMLGRVASYYHSAQDKAYISHRLDLAVSWANANGIRRDQLLMGEFSAQCEDYKTMPNFAADCMRYDADVREAAEQHGIATAYWGIYDFRGFVLDPRGQVRPELARALALP